MRRSSAFSLLLLAALLPSFSNAGIVDCYFVYQEIPGGTEIPRIPSAVKTGTVPDCPPGLYDNTTWPTDGCRMQCGSASVQDCIAFGYITPDKSVLHMSCADSISSSNPDGANVLSCEQNEEWAMKQSQSQQSKDRKVAQHMCDTCSFEDYCLPPLMRDHEGPLAEVGEDALDLPPGFEDDTTGSDMMGKDSASGKSPSHSYMGILAALVWVPIILFI